MIYLHLDIHGKEIYLLYSDFLQGNLYELEKITTQYNQKYKGLFQKKNKDLKKQDI